MRNELTGQFAAHPALSGSFCEAQELGSIRFWPADYGASLLPQRPCRDKAHIVTSVSPASLPTEVDRESQGILLQIHKILRMNPFLDILVEATAQLPGSKQCIRIFQHRQSRQVLRNARVAYALDADSFVRMLQQR